MVQEGAAVVEVVGRPQPGGMVGGVQVVQEGAAVVAVVVGVVMQDSILGIINALTAFCKRLAPVDSAVVASSITLISNLQVRENKKTKIQL